MFNRSNMSKFLVQYKKALAFNHWETENYKWKAIKCFQDNWDINAADFPEMLECSLKMTQNLLTSSNYFPQRMIIAFAKKFPEEVRSMFENLFDESKDVVERIEKFKDTSSSILNKFGENAKNHYQTENAISIYLWLRYPDKYYIYKIGEIKKVANALESKYQFKNGDYENNLRNFIQFYNEVNSELKNDEELVNIFKSLLTDECYPDPELKTLTLDFGFFISRSFSDKNNKKNSAEEWIGEDYDPGLTVEEWWELIKNKAVFTTQSLEIMKRIKDFGGKASCTQLANKYGETANFYNAGSVGLAKRICNEAKITADNKEGKTKWWPILYTGRNTQNDEEGHFIWKLRDELSKALDKVDLSNINLYSDAKAESDSKGYWWLNANPKIWSFSDIAVGETQDYTLKNENGNKRRVFQNFIDAKAGDMIICYESNPVKQVVAIGQITAEQDGEKISFEKIETLASPIDYSVLKECDELQNMEYFRSPQGSLFKLTKEEFDFIMDIIRDENPLPIKTAFEAYTKENFLNEVFMNEEKYDELVSILSYKKNIILQGAPGVGKTFTARRLAWSMMGEKDDSRIEFVQFHQNYSYEDFIMGYKPTDSGFDLKYGVFYRFCQKAATQPYKDFFFIIDEINRGNMSKIFGELLMLIEKDYRGTKATLAYNGLPFSVPKNLYIIGMMNTADRSLAMIDYALRRRFSFFDMEPGFDTKGFIRYADSLHSETFNKLVNRVKELNNAISSDSSLGKGFCIGHSYLYTNKNYSDEWLHCVVKYDILPILNEYWFDNESEFQKWKNILEGVFND